ncbi:helix-turn-helix domain-containing protein [Paenibacillus sp. Marseille-Q4541]|uniref:helix-turn-helix domain-containing protein n=1 Tax=Paenibacillus sp. Marseille-Q4541 TaxID=2831522 RepID=UPI001BA49093|nr:helix-turn-helix domain-containing protein [Paenibacillus sp. Marseille-Q4541]
MKLHSVIIIDDERWIIEGIKAGVDWGAYGFEVIGEATNGIDGLALIEKLQPNVVFTDIRMPGFNGLEVIQKAKHLSPESKFIVLSGHAEFAYAKKALDYGTFGYCLKPFDLYEIHHLLSKLMIELSPEPKPTLLTVSSADLYERICSGNISEIRKIMTQYGLGTDENLIVTPAVSVGTSILHLVDTDVPCIEFQMGLHRYGYLLNTKDMNQFQQDISIRVESSNFNIGLGFSITDLSELHKSIEAATLAAYRIFITEIPGVFSHRAQTSSRIDEILKSISDSFNRRDHVMFATSIELSRTRFFEGEFSIKEAYMIYHLVMCLFFQEENSRPSFIFEGYDQLLRQFTTSNAMLDYLLVHAGEYFSEELYKRIPTVNHKRVQEILSYIHLNFTQDISIHSLSERFSLSPNYLCHLFKKEVGDSFSEYISRQRIQYACKLLIETNQHINQISEQVGFKDYFYFSKLFKRFNAMTPTQYRDQHMENSPS